MNTSELKSKKKYNKKLIIGLICLVIGITSLIIGLNYLVYLEDEKIKKSQDDYYAQFTITATYHGFNGYYLVSARQLPDMPHSSTHTYDWLFLIGRGGEQHYFQNGIKPILPTKEELCNIGISDVDNCLDRMILEKLK